MISYKLLRKELKQYPKYIQREICNGNLEEALRLQHVKETIEWILKDNDND